MADIKINGNLDLQKAGQLLGALMELIVGSASSPAEAQFWYNSSTKHIEFYNGTTTKVLAEGDLADYVAKSLFDATVARDAARGTSGASREELAAHLALVPIYMPGLTMKRAGEPRQCQGWGLVDWVAEGPDGSPKARGTNVFTLAPDGRLARVTGLWAAG